jgi:hypothetical protein
MFFFNSLVEFQMSAEPEVVENEPSVEPVTKKEEIVPDLEIKEEAKEESPPTEDEDGMFRGGCIVTFFFFLLRPKDFRSTKYPFLSIKFKVGYRRSLGQLFRTRRKFKAAICKQLFC